MDFGSPNFSNALLSGFNTGREMKRQDGLNNALAGYLENPGNPGALSEIARYDAPAAMQLQQRQAQQAKAQAEAQAAQQQAGREQMLITGKLLNSAVDEGSYQQSLAAAKQYGIDVSKAPPQYDPAWVQQQRMIVDAFSKDEGQSISGIARELSDAGYKPGTPEFADAMRGVINNKYASEYVDDQGNTRRRSALNLGAQPPAPSPQASSPQGQQYQGPHMTVDQARSIGQGTNFLAWQKKAGTPVMVNTPEEASALPAGTLMVTPDGRTGVKR